MIKKGKKIVILGAGNVGATIAYTLTLQGLASQIVLIDINEGKAKGEALDIIQGTAFCPPVNIYAGSYEDAKDADIVIMTLGMARKPGMTRIDLAQNNVNIVKSVMPQIVKSAPDAIYLIVSNPVDILTYVVAKTSGLPQSQVIGSGTLLDSSRLRYHIAERSNFNSKNVHAHVLGEHGDTSVVAWSLANIGGLSVAEYCEDPRNELKLEDLKAIENDMRTAGASVIGYKGATFYAVALSVARICECIVRDTGSILTVSGMMNGQYGISDVCLSIPFVVGARGITRDVTPVLEPSEEALLQKSAESLKSVINSLDI